MGKASELIKNAMIERGVSQGELARMCNKSRQLVSTNLRDSSSKGMSFKTFSEYADVLGYEILLVKKEPNQEISNKQSPITGWHITCEGIADDIICNSPGEALVTFSTKHEQLINDWIEDESHIHITKKL